MIYEISVFCCINSNLGGKKSGIDLDNLWDFYIGTCDSVINAPIDGVLYIINIPGNVTGRAYQQIMSVGNTNVTMMYRNAFNGVWREWETPATTDTLNGQNSTTDSINLDTILENGSYYVSNTATNNPFGEAGILTVVGYRNKSGTTYRKAQLFISTSGSATRYYYNSWSAWIKK